MQIAEDSTENMAKTLYFNIEDDVKSITERLKREPGADFTLVFPRRSYIFSDPVNLKLLRKQLELLRKNAAILTMDERGRQAASEAGFALQELPTRGTKTGTADIAIRPAKTAPAAPHVDEATPEEPSEAPAPPQPHVTARASDSVRPKVRAVPAVAIHDTIFSDVRKRSTLETSDLRAMASRSGRRRTVWLGAAVLLVVIVALLLVYIIPSAQVVVHAKAEAVTRDLEIVLGTSTKTTDVNTLSMPATAFDQTVQVENKFESAGKKEVGSKAEGKVRVFNLTGSSINLRAATTTLSSGDKKYSFTTDQQFIPAISAKNASNPNSGHVAVVVAMEGGDSFNLPVGTRLEITNQVFGNKPQLLYAVVDEALVGGSSRFVSVIEAADVTRAQNELTAMAASQVADTLKGQGQYLAEQAYAAEIGSFTTEKPAGAESPNFNAQLTVRLRGLSFDPVVLTELVRNRVTQVLPTGGHLQPAGKDLMTFKVRQVDVPAGSLRLIVHLESRMLKDVDTEAFPEKITGLSKDKATAALTQGGNVDRVDIVIKPSWRDSLPRLAGRIEVVQSQD